MELKCIVAVLRPEVLIALEQRLGALHIHGMPGECAWIRQASRSRCRRGTRACRRRFPSARRAARRDRARRA